MAQDKVFNRLQMIYGPCIRLSYITALANSDGIVRLFKLGGTGAKEIASGNRLQLYKDDKQLALGSKARGLYTFDGVELLPPIYGVIWKAPQDKYIVIIDGAFGIININGVKLTDIAYKAVILYKNGIGALIGQESAYIFNWAHNNKRDGEQYETISIQARKHMSFNQIVVLFTESTEVADVYTLYFEKLGSVEISSIPSEDVKYFELTNGSKVYTAGISGSLIDVEAAGFGTKWNDAVAKMEHIEN